MRRCAMLAVLCLLCYACCAVLCCAMLAVLVLWVVVWVVLGNECARPLAQSTDSSLAPLPVCPPHLQGMTGGTIGGMLVADLILGAPLPLPVPVPAPGRCRKSRRSPQITHPLQALPIQKLAALHNHTCTTGQASHRS